MEIAMATASERRRPTARGRKSSMADRSNQVRRVPERGTPRTRDTIVRSHRGPLHRWQHRILAEPPAANSSTDQVAKALDHGCPTTRRRGSRRTGPSKQRRQAARRCDSQLAVRFAEALRQMERYDAPVYRSGRPARSSPFEPLKPVASALFLSSTIAALLFCFLDFLQRPI